MAEGPRTPPNPPANLGIRTPLAQIPLPSSYSDSSGSSTSSDSGSSDNDAESDHENDPHYQGDPFNWYPPHNPLPLPGINALSRTPYDDAGWQLTNNQILWFGVGMARATNPSLFDFLLENNTSLFDIPRAVFAWCRLR
jgi:hypothetical protein